jgi:hypothetical protein
MRTGFTQGPRDIRLVPDEGGKLMINFDKGLTQSIKDAVANASWLKESDQGAVMTAILLAETMEAHEHRRHQIAPILIGLLSNLGLISGARKVGEKEMTPEEALAVLVNG